ncbi:hypothetical protein T09_10160 [Trichinella sp. T9]|nr:hypothetical protein T09_10160 [Trichinella sp. T9]
MVDSYPLEALPKVRKNSCHILKPNQEQDVC